MSVAIIFMIEELKPDISQSRDTSVLPIHLFSTRATSPRPVSNPRHRKSILKAQGPRLIFAQFKKKIIN
jgi:hypothetical protein